MISALRSLLIGQEGEVNALRIFHHVFSFAQPLNWSGRGGETPSDDFIMILAMHSLLIGQVGEVITLRIISSCFQLCASL